MTGPRCRSAIIAATAIALTSSVSSLAIAQAQDTTRTIAKNESIFIDGKTLTITQGASKDDAGAQIAKLNAREVGPGAIIFRANDKLYIVDAGAPPQLALNDPANERQRSYGGMYDRQQSYGGLNDQLADRQRSYGGLNDQSADRQRSYGGLNDQSADRQRSYGGLNDQLADRQRSYGGMYDRQQSYGGMYDRQQSYGGLNDRQQSYGGLNDRQQSYGGMFDPDYANFKLKKTFDEIWGTTAKK